MEIYNYQTDNILLLSSKEEEYYVETN